MIHISSIQSFISLSSLNTSLPIPTPQKSNHPFNIQSSLQSSIPLSSLNTYPLDPTPKNPIHPSLQHPNIHPIISLPLSIQSKHPSSNPNPQKIQSIHHPVIRPSIQSKSYSFYPNPKYYPFNIHSFIQHPSLYPV